MKKIAALSLIVLCFSQAPLALADTQKSGSAGLEGTVPSPPPSQGATIIIPKTGQNFSNLPIVVSGICPVKTLVEIYDNNVFTGSTECNNGSFSLQVDLFNGKNDLIARVYDSLDQRGPDSNKVSVIFGSAISTGSPKVTLTTQYAKRGANPGDILNWPVTISGGTPPYAFTIDWGDKSDPDLISVSKPGNLNIQHTYAQSGVYNVVIKAVDSKGGSAFLQVVAIANGPVHQAAASNNSSLTVETKVLIWPLIVLAVLMVIAFWVGKRHQLEAIKNRLRKGDAPF